MCIRDRCSHCSSVLKIVCAAIEMACENCVVKYTECVGWGEEQLINWLLHHGVIAPSAICRVCENVVLLNRGTLGFRCGRLYRKYAKSKMVKCSWSGSARAGTFIGDTRLPPRVIFGICATFMLINPPWQTSWWESMIYHRKPSLTGTLSSDRFASTTCLRVAWKNWASAVKSSRSTRQSSAAENTTEVASWRDSTTIVSNCWKAYRSLEEAGFEHLTVNHSIEFVDARTGAHTNTIERQWLEVRSRVPVSYTHLDVYKRQ